jgi:hypothetical protein
MSDPYGIPMVAAALRRTLDAALRAELPSARATIAPSTEPDLLPHLGVNLTLFQITHNPALRSANATAIPGKAPLVLELHFLLSFYGDWDALEPLRCMGLALEELHARPILTRQVIQHTIEDLLEVDPTHFVGRSKLADQEEPVTFTYRNLEPEELLRLGGPGLHLAYTAAPVVVEGNGPPPPMYLPPYPRP